MINYDFIQKQDKEIYDAIVGERKRQQEGLELIPSENYVSQAVLETASSVLTNKYSEGYPGKRYYGGQYWTDKVETLAIERAKKLFGAKYANVQPHSGANANVAMYFALLQPGDTVLGMDLSHGGHLTHGHPVTYITKIFNFVRYKIKDVNTGQIDYDEMLQVAKEVRPKILLAGFSAYTRELDYVKMVEIAKEVGAITVMDAAHIAGLIAGGALQNPFDAGFDIITSTTHKTLRGPRGGIILVKESEELANKINKSVFPGLQGGPLMHQIAGKAVAFHEALHPNFQTYAKQVIKNAKAMEEVFVSEGIPMVSGGTDNHMLLVDVQKGFGIDGDMAQNVLDETGITLNKNMIPDDANPPMKPSGIRFGTPAITSRGFKEEDCKQVAQIMIKVLKDSQNSQVIELAKQEVSDLARKNPIPVSYV